MTRNVNFSIPVPFSVRLEKVRIISVLAGNRIWNRQLIILRLSDLSGSLETQSNLTWS